MRPRTTASDTALGSRAIALVVIAAVAVGAYFWFRHRTAEPPALVSEPALPEPTGIEPTIEHPVAVAPAALLPALNESDPAVSEQLSELVGPVELVRPNVLYEFADPLLEARSAGQKLMLRIGPQNATRVKAQLRELRRRIADQAP